MSISNEKRAELMLEHHKDTAERISFHWRLRNRIFLFLLVVISLMGLDAYSSELLPDLTNAYLASTLTSENGKPPTFDFSAVGSAVWFILLSLTIQYYQRSIHVARLYEYISDLEVRLSKSMGGNYISREGGAYFSEDGASDDEAIAGAYVDKRPLFLRAVGPLYVYIFPMLLTIAVITMLVKDNLDFDKTTDFFNLFLGTVIVFYNILYIIWAKWRR